MRHRLFGARRRAGEALGMTSGLRRRLLVMLIAPLILLALLNAWFDYRSADNVALQQDQRLLSLVPLGADSVIGQGEPLLLLLAHPLCKLDLLFLCLALHIRTV